MHRRRKGTTRFSMLEGFEKYHFERSSDLFDGVLEFTRARSCAQSFVHTLQSPLVGGGTNANQVSRSYIGDPKQMQNKPQNTDTKQTRTGTKEKRSFTTNPLVTFGRGQDILGCIQSHTEDTNSVFADLQTTQPVMSTYKHTGRFRQNTRENS